MPRVSDSFVWGEAWISVSLARAELRGAGFGCPGNEARVRLFQMLAVGGGKALGMGLVMSWKC